MSDNYDFFISYNHKDEQWATWIARTLEDSGYTTIIQAWDFRPGNNFVLEMQKAVTKSRKILLVLSENYLESVYCQPEWAAAINLDPTGINRKVIPVRIENISPPGLLSQIVYIDLCNLSEESAKTSLIMGIRSDDLRESKKPIFPKKDMGHIAATAQKASYEFIFILNKDSVVESLSPRTKNNLREWFVNGCIGDFEVTICDDRMKICYEHLEEIIKKIQHEEDLTKEEEHTYDVHMRAIRKCEREVAHKKQACIFFLKDVFLHNYFHIHSYVGLCVFIEKILNFDFHNDRIQTGDDLSSYIQLDFFLEPPPKECHDHFTVPLEMEKVKKIFEGISVYHLFRRDAADLGSELLKDAAIYYYFFLAEEVIDYKTRIVENKKAMNLLHYKIGLH